MQDTAGSLQRRLGVGGATVMGLGSILGTGVFVGIAVSAGLAGPAVILAVIVGAFVATCNGLSSAQLAASHPVSGGTYAYGYRYLHPALGFTAGWMFLCAKSASAASAALGFAGYTLHLFPAARVGLHVPVALAAVVALTIVVLLGIRRSNRVNTLIVLITIAALVAFILAGLPGAMRNGADHLGDFFMSGQGDDRSVVPRLLEACALMFVAYTGYGRIATMGEEITDPKRNIPRAIITTLVVSMLLYLGVAVVGVAAAGAAGFGSHGTQTVAPLELAARTFNMPGIAPVMALGAITAMLGVLLNLILGLSRVLYAMGRQGDAPAVTATVSAKNQSPNVAVVIVGVIIAGLALLGDVKLTWSFSAFTVLVYYAITNLCALRLPPEARLYPRIFAWMGLFACLFLAFWVPVDIWLVGLGLIAAGLVWHRLRGVGRKDT